MLKGNILMEPVLEIETNLLPPEQIPAAPFEFPKAWRKSTISKEDYFFQFPDKCLMELEKLSDELQKNCLPALITRPEMYELENCKVFMKKIKEVLDNGVGFAIMEKLPIDSVPLEVATTMHWLLGSLLGRPVAQNFKDGKMLYEVMDLTAGKGKNIIGVRGSHTNADLSFHTDCSSNIAPPDYVGLMCVRPALEGGESQLTNWYSVYNKLLESRPDLCARGFKPILFDRQREHSDDDPRILSRPPFAFDGNITLRYSERLNRQGYKIAKQSMDQETEDMLSAIDEILTDPEMRVDLNFESGQIQWINNASIGHRRTSYVDHPGEPSLRRCLVRMWLREEGKISYLG